MDRYLLNALIPPRTQILQVRLRPFSLGHLAALRYIQSPLLGNEGESFTPFDLFVAVLICTKTWDELCAFIADPDESAKSVRAWMEKVGPVDIVQKAAEFRRYVMDGQTAPEFEAPESSGRPGVSVEQRMRIALIKLGLSDREIMDRPLTLCWYDYLTDLSNDGCVRIITSEAAAFDDELFKLADQWQTTASE